MSTKKTQKKLANLLYLEITRIIDDLVFRKEVLYKLWSKHRTRKPLIETLFSRYKTLDFKDLLVFDSSLIKQIDDFYKLLDNFIFYVSYTEDMPQTMSNTFNRYVKELQEKATPILKKLNKITSTTNNKEH